jgi:hypothetical protein
MIEWEELTGRTETFQGFFTHGSEDQWCPDFSSAFSWCMCGRHTRSRADYVDSDTSFLYDLVR